MPHFSRPHLYPLDYSTYPAFQSNFLASPNRISSNVLYVKICISKRAKVYAFMLLSGLEAEFVIFSPPFFVHVISLNAKTVLA